MKSKLLLILTPLVVPLAALQAQSSYGTPYAFTTSAGLAGDANSTDDPGTGNLARFNHPASMAIDGSGNIYVADTNNHTIRKITSAGAVTTYAGSAGNHDSTNALVATDARFNLPNGVAVDGDGNVYVADTGNHTIRKIAANGTVTTFAGSPGNLGSNDAVGTNAHFFYPFAVAAQLDGAGHLVYLFVADTDNHTIRRITPSGVVTTFAGKANVPVGSNDAVVGTDARFSFPSGLTVDGAGNVYVADTVNNTIRKITPAGAVTTLAGTAGSAESTDGAGTAARFNNPYGVTFDGSSGNLFVADTLNSTIRRISATGMVTTLAGSPLAFGSADNTGSAARFTSPWGVAVAALGKLYVADASDNTIRSGRAVVSHDFNGDRKSDIVWQNTTTGDRSIWLMNGTAFVDGAFIGTIPTDWKIAGTTDFNGDGKSDLLWENTVTGDHSAWLMDGPAFMTGGYLGQIPTEWKVASSADFNGDGKADLLWANTVTGDHSIWLMDGVSFLAGGYLGQIPTEWSVSYTGDLNGDGKADLIWQNNVTGDRTVWLMNGTQFLAGGYLGQNPLEWKVALAADFNGDGNADLLWENATTGGHTIWLMNGVLFLSGAVVGPGDPHWVAESAGDYNGDGKADLVWKNTVTGERAIWLMNGTSFVSGASLGVIGLDWSIAR